MRRRGARPATIFLDPDPEWPLRREVLRGDLVANLGHKLKTPVDALVLLAEAMRAEEDLDALSRLAERVGIEAERTRAMLGDLLELGRIEADAWSDRGRVQVRDVVADAVDRVRPAAHARDILIEVTEGPSHLSVFGSRRQLSSAIGNLLENAVRYSHEHDRVTLRVSRREGSIEVIVSDRGIGIGECDLPYVFERFYRSATSKGHDGIGLGLAIAREVARDHGGEVTVDSAEGAGSTFTLRLPMAVFGRVDL